MYLHSYLLCCVTEKKPFVRVRVKPNVKVIKIFKKVPSENCHLLFWHLYAIFDNSDRRLQFNREKKTEASEGKILLSSELYDAHGLEYELLEKLSLEESVGELNCSNIDMKMLGIDQAICTESLHHN